MKTWLAGSLLVCGLAVATPPPASAATVEVIGGTTSVALDTDALALAGLEIAGVTPAVGSGPDGVVFGVNGPDAPFPQRQSTLSFDPTDLTTLSGTIEHTGSVLFNGEGIVTGNFTIAPGGPAGFTVTDNVSLAGLVLFDAAPTNVVVEPGRLLVEGTLAVSQAFADALVTGGFTQLDLGGAPIGTFVTDTVVTPLPGAVVLAGTALAGLGLLRRGQLRRKAAAAA